MPQKCQHYSHLLDRISILTYKFMYSEIAGEISDPAGYIVDVERIGAYKLMVHAEIEFFLESKAKENIDKINLGLNGASQWMRAAPELVAIAMGLNIKLPESRSIDVSKFNTFVADLISAAKKFIKENNGIKSQSFEMLSILSGKTIDELDLNLSDSLSLYGKARGDIAHSTVVRVRSIDAPSAEVGKVESIIKELGLFFDVEY